MKGVIDLYNKQILDFDCSELPDGLISGKLGIVLYFLSLYDSRKENIYVERARSLLEEVFERANLQIGDHIYLYSSFSKGLTGLVYVLHLMYNDDLLDEDANELINELSDIIFERSLKMFEEENFTFFDGPIGNLAMFNFIDDQARAEQLIDRLYHHCIENEYPFYTRLNDPYTDGINLGMNYGYLSIINALLPHIGKNKKADLVVNRCLDLINKWLDLSYEMAGAYIYKPHNLTFKNSQLVPYQNNRLCWCNSDLSYTYILYKISQQYPRMDTRNLADRIGKETIKRRAFENTGIQFAQFCHGTSGLTKLYSELAAIDPVYKHTEEYWLSRTIEYLEIDKNYVMDKSDLSLLFGKIGALMVMDHSINSSKYLKFLF